MPHIELRGIDGTTFSYRDIWQRRNLLLVNLPPKADTGEEHEEAVYLDAIQAHGDALREYETEVVITRDAVPHLTAPAVLIADRWGEILAAASANRAADLLPVAEILEWLRFVAHACPECEGEAK
jgi:hypothetical protein